MTRLWFLSLGRLLVSSSVVSGMIWKVSRTKTILCDPASVCCCAATSSWSRLGAGEAARLDLHL